MHLEIYSSGFWVEDKKKKKKNISQCSSMSVDCVSSAEEFHELEDLIQKSARAFVNQTNKKKKPCWDFHKDLYNDILGVNKARSPDARVNRNGPC